MDNLKFGTSGLRGLVSDLIGWPSYAVRQDGKLAGSPRHAPPTRRCQAIAASTSRTGRAFGLPGGSARTRNQATSSKPACSTMSFRRVS